MYLDFAQWAFVFSAISTASSIVALYFSYQSQRIASKSARLAQEQHDLKKPKLVGYLANAEFTTDDGNRIYQFSISVSNRSDNNNSLARIELVVKYRTPEFVPATIRLPSRQSPGSLSTPLDIDAHKTVSGQVIFYADRELLKGMTIDEYCTVMTDAHDEEFELSANLVTEILDEESIS